MKDRLLDALDESSKNRNTYWNQWEHFHGLQKVTKQGTVQELINSLIALSVKLAEHLQTLSWQHNQYAEIQLKLPRAGAGDLFFVANSFFFKFFIQLAVKDGLNKTENHLYKPGIEINRFSSGIPTPQKLGFHQRNQ